MYTTIRIPESQLREADALVPRLERSGFNAMRASRSAVLRAALQRGLAVLAQELPAVQRKETKRP